MRYSRLVVALHKLVSCEFECRNADLNSVESDPALLEVDLNNRTIKIPSDGCGVYSLMSFMNCANSIRVADHEYRTGILDSEVSPHTDVRVLGWFFRYVYLFLVKAGYFNEGEL